MANSSVVGIYNTQADLSAKAQKTLHIIRALSLSEGAATGAASCVMVAGLLVGSQVKGLGHSMTWPFIAAGP